MDNNLEENLRNEILHQIKSTKRLITKFKNEIENKEIIVCMGNTRSGKSTTVNLLQGNELEAFNDGRRFYISERDNSNESGPIISHGSLSFTKYPSLWEVNNDVLVVDAPGLDDNRGLPHDIVNSLYFDQLKYAKSVRFALIVDINDILGDNVNGFTNAVEKMQSVIGDFNELKDSVCVIFTKDCNNYKREDLANMLKKKIVNVGEMQVKKELVYHFAKNINLIGIFKMPEAEGLINEEIACNVAGAIFNTQPVVLNVKNIKFLPSKQAHHTLLEVYQKYSVALNFEDEMKSFLRNFENYFTVEKYVFASTEEELHDTKGRMQFCLPRVTSEKVKNLAGLYELKQSLLNIAGDCSEQFESKFNFLEFMDSLGLLDGVIKTLIVTKYKNALSKLEARMNKLISKIEQEINDRASETIQYILSGAVADKAKVVVLGASTLPLVTKALNAVGVEVPKVSFEILQLSSAGWGLLGAASLGVAAGGAGVHYYNTIHLRRQFRKEQGRY